MKMCAIVVLYNPDSNFIENIEKITRQIEMVIIVDNHSKRQIKIEEEILAKLDGNQTLFIKNKENFGVAKALNQGTDFGIKLGFEWMVFFDQDTLIYPFFKSEYEKILDRFPDLNKIGIIGANFMDPNRHKNLFVEQPNLLWLNRKSVITSGSAIYHQTYIELGRFAESYFIDHVDDEYCARARKAGYLVIVSTKPLMEHEIGAYSTHKVLGLQLETSNHSEFRWFYLIRNFLFLTKEYFMFDPIWILKIALFKIKNVALVIAFENNKRQKLSSMIRGCLAFFSPRRAKL
jgi:rhamnosyltransferase